MAGSATSERFDQMASSTLNTYTTKTLQDVIFQADPLFALLYTKGKKDKYMRGGNYIETPLMYGKNETGMSYSGLEVLDTSTTEGIGNALFPWRMYNISITVANEDLLKNQGDAQVLDLLKAKIRQAELSMMDDLTDMLYGDGTGNNNKDIMGLLALVGTGTVAGIDSGTYTWWASKTNSTVTALDSSWMRTMVNDVRGSGATSAVKGADVGRVDLILTTQDLFESFEGKVEPTLRTQDTKLGSLGFDALKFKGAELTWSDKVPAGYMYFLSTEYMGLKCHPERDFKSTPFVEPHNQDGRVAHIRFMGNMVTSNRRRLGVATAKTA
ncbi:MAG: phage major capsid protein [Bacteroidales bacterium]|jgi:hypothetical protein|nr:phage major capsid protein [Bacteroidales bacterium]